MLDDRILQFIVSYGIQEEKEFKIKDDLYTHTQFFHQSGSISHFSGFGF